MHKARKEPFPQLETAKKHLAQPKNFKKNEKTFFQQMSSVSHIVSKTLRSPLCSQTIWFLVKIEGELR